MRCLRAKQSVERVLSQICAERQCFPLTESSLHTGSVPRRSARGPRPGSLAPPSVAPQLARKASKPGTPAQWPGPLSPEGGLWARRGHAPVGVRGRVCERKGCFGRAVSGSDSNGNTQPFCGSCMLPGAAGLTNSPMQWLLLMSPSVRCGRQDHQGPEDLPPRRQDSPGAQREAEGPNGKGQRHRGLSAPSPGGSRGNAPQVRGPGGHQDKGQAKPGQATRRLVCDTERERRGGPSAGRGGGKPLRRWVRSVPGSDATSHAAAAEAPGMRGADGPPDEGPDLLAVIPSFALC